jgi:hypothetical protein
MGIFPYTSPKEQLESQVEIEYQWRRFPSYYGYSELRGDAHNNPARVYKSYKTGKEYVGVNEYFDDVKGMPQYEKDGICYTLTDIQKIHNYKDPWYEQVDFLGSHGYKRYVMDEDYIKANYLLEAHYNEHGWVPRWIKDGKLFDHFRLLDELKWEHDGVPAYKRPNEWWRV